MLVGTFKYVSRFFRSPGSEILSSSIKRGNSEYKTGTSQAAPFVTGVAALYLEHDKSMSSETLSEYLLDSHASADVLTEIGEGSPNLLVQSSGASELAFADETTRPVNTPGSNSPFSCGFFLLSTCTTDQDCCIPYCRSLGVLGVRCWLW